MALPKARLPKHDVPFHRIVPSHIEVCSVDILVARSRISTGSQGDSFRETRL